MPGPKRENTDPFEAWLKWLVINGYGYIVQSGRGDYVQLIEG
jgi:hypothetical protein